LLRSPQAIYPQTTQCNQLPSTTNKYICTKAVRPPKVVPHLAMGDAEILSDDKTPASQAMGGIYTAKGEFCKTPKNV
jgi:hypothetical protein